VKGLCVGGGRHGQANKIKKRLDYLRRRREGDEHGLDENGVPLLQTGGGGSPGDLCMSSRAIHMQGSHAHVVVGGRPKISFLCAVSPLAEAARGKKRKRLNGKKGPSVHTALSAPPSTSPTAGPVSSAKTRPWLSRR
jgi:hypothetical protein